MADEEAEKVAEVVEEGDLDSGEVELPICGDGVRSTSGRSRKGAHL